MMFDPGFPVITPLLEDVLKRRPYNAVTDFVDANVARGLGDKVAFTDATRSLTYAQLQERSYRFAAALKALGLREETRVILVFHDTVDYPVAFWGAIRAGIVPVPVNTLLTAEQYAYLFADSRAAAIVTAVSLAPTVLPLRDRLPHLRAVIVVGASAQQRPRLPDVHFFEELLEKAEPIPFTAPTMSDEVALWMYTSGSTGEPKAVRHVHTSLMATARLMGQGIIGIREDDVAFSAAKLSFSYGLGNAVSFPMSVGASTVLLPERPTPHAVLAMLRRHQPTIFYAVPSLYAALLAHPEIGPGAGSKRLRLCISAGEALPAHLGERWREMVGVDVLDGLGSTEMLQTFLSNRPGDVRYGSTGKPVPAASFPPARSANSWCAGPLPGKATGISARKAAAPSSASGPIPATSTCATRRVTTTTAAGPTICSRSTACGYRRSRSRPRWCHTRRCSKPPSSARRMATA
jgi:benzoate-CoA ligase family protein